MSIKSIFSSLQFHILSLLQHYHLLSIRAYFLVPSKVPYPVSFIVLSPFVNQSLFFGLALITFSYLAPIFLSLKFHIMSLLQHYHLQSIRAYFIISLFSLFSLSGIFNILPISFNLFTIYTLYHFGLFSLLGIIAIFYLSFVRAFIPFQSF